MKKIAALGTAFLLALNGVMPGTTQALRSASNSQPLKVSRTKLNDWMGRWERNILSEKAMQYCRKEAGEEIGWKISPFLKGFYNGYLATGNSLWVDRLIACTDAWLKRAVEEPDGYPGWPKVEAAGTVVDNLDSFYADSMLGEAMALTPIVLMAAKIKTTSLVERFGSRADDYMRLAEHIFNKWDSRGVWREAGSGGIITVVLPFGINQKTRNWTDEYDKRNALEVGFSHPDNKANLIATWLLAMFDATGEAIYKDRAEKWFKTMKSRMKERSNGTYEIWNYWEPAGVWDYKSNALPKHWVGVHPNGGYYEIDVEAIVAAYEHHLVFNEEDINRLIKTAITDKRYWTALAPYDETIQQHFESNIDPNNWSGLTTVPWYAAIQRRNDSGNEPDRTQAP